MGWKGLYIGVFVILLSCQSKHVVVDVPITNVKTKPEFPIKAIAEIIQTTVNKKSDSCLYYIYDNNEFEPIWKSDTLIEQGISWLQNAKFHGLNPSDYSILTIKDIFEKLSIDSSGYLNNYAKLDILLTLSIKKCGERIRYSRLNPKNFYPGWNYSAPSSLPNDSVWINLIKNDEINKLDSHFEPKQRLYPKLKAELKHFYSCIESAPETFIKYPGFNLYIGDSNKYVLPIKHKLLGINSDSVISMVYDEELHKALILFQRKHGLNPDGIIGKHTYHYLNWSTETYISILKANMERLRWLPDSILNRGLVVNIPSQQMKLHQNDSCIISSKVIVGSYKHQTPVFQSKINYLVFNPCWTVPKSIATTTVLNGLKRDSSYLQKRNMFICLNGLEVNADSIDFDAYSKNYFPFQVFQGTCKQNALGAVKFMFTNRYSIYMHDTPQKSLFNKDIRNFSHGCIRVQNALQLAETVLYKLDHQQTSIQKYLSKGYPEKVYLKNTIPIYILYLTCWEDDECGALIFCKDIYLKDYKIIRELEKLE